MGLLDNKQLKLRGFTIFSEGLVLDLDLSRTFFDFLEEDPPKILRKHPSSLQLNLDLVLGLFFLNAFVLPIVFWAQM